MKGKFIVLDGVDGSGKATQVNFLIKKLAKMGYKVKKIEFPQYNRDSSALIKDYLNGKFGKIEQVGPYRGSVFYAVDRYAASFQINNWLANGYIVVADRYVSSNKGHQASKISSSAERKKFVEWINHFEYKIMGIPIPDVTLFLHVPAEIGYKAVLKKPARNYLGKKKRDVLEKDLNHLRKAERTYKEMSAGIDKVEHWVEISCTNDKEMIAVPEINQRILDTLKRHKIITKRFKKA